MSKICCLVGPEFEDSELAVPVRRLEAEGHEVEYVGQHGGVELVGKGGKERITTDASVVERRPDVYAALLIPGGKSPAHLRGDHDVAAFVREFAATKRPIAAICHGPQLLIDAGLVRGVRMTAWPAVQQELEAAGADVADEEVVEDEQFITSRKPEDLEAFCDALIERLNASEGTRTRRSEEFAAPPPH